MRRAFLLLCLIAAPTSAVAHILGRSFSDLKPTAGGVEVLFDIDPADLAEPLRSRFDDDASGRIELDEMQAHVNVLNALASGGYIVRRGDKRCKPTVRSSRTTPGAGLVRIAMRFDCPNDERLGVDFALARRMRRGHVHFLTARLPDGVVGATLGETSPSWRQPVEPTTLQNVWGFFLLGLEHILIGYDHLLFLFALLLVSLKVKELVKIVTAFTVAHSITLLGAALGTLSISSKIVEPAIALTIVYVGVENFFIARPTRRWILTFVLGLVHGFGFASMLGQTGLPANGRVLSLLSFNVGVEVGQLAVVLLIVPALNRLQQANIGLRAQLTILGGALLSAAALSFFEPAAALGLALMGTLAVFLTPRWGFRRVILQGGSATVVGLGMTWFVMRLL